MRATIYVEPHAKGRPYLGNLDKILYLLAVPDRMGSAIFNSTMLTSDIFSSTYWLPTIKTFCLWRGSFRAMLKPPFSTARGTTKTSPPLCHRLRKSKIATALSAFQCHTPYLICTLFRTVALSSSRWRSTELFFTVRASRYTGIIFEAINKYRNRAFSICDEFGSQFSNLPIIFPYDTIRGIKNGFREIINVNTLSVFDTKNYSYSEKAIAVRSILYNLFEPPAQIFFIITRFLWGINMPASGKSWPSFGHWFNLQVEMHRNHIIRKLERVFSQIYSIIHHPNYTTWQVLNQVIIPDDAQIVNIHAKKAFAEAGTPPRIEFVLEREYEHE